MRYYQVDPTTFIDTTAGKPAHGRGCWNRVGIDFDYRYSLAPDKQIRIGAKAERGLDYWAVARGCYAIQERLLALEVLTKVTKFQQGVFNEVLQAAVVSFQDGASDPMGGAALDNDGTVGRSDCRALFTPIILDAERKYGIPNRNLLGEMYHESQLDPGAVGYFIYYPDYRGVDRGIAQINDRAHPEISWDQAFDVPFAVDWSAAKMRGYFDAYRKKYPATDEAVLWDAAICAHNNPSAGGQWASKGFAPSASAASYVAAVKAARY